MRGAGELEQDRPVRGHQQIPRGRVALAEDLHVPGSGGVADIDRIREQDGGDAARLHLCAEARLPVAAHRGKVDPLAFRRAVEKREVGQIGAVGMPVERGHRGLRQAIACAFWHPITGLAAPPETFPRRTATERRGMRQDTPSRGPPPRFLCGAARQAGGGQREGKPEMLRDVLKLGMLLETEAYRRAARASRPDRRWRTTPTPKPRGARTGDLGWRHARRVKTANENRPVAGGDAYAAGQAAAAEGRAATENPYLPGHPGFERWRLGWAARRAS
jgi:hypothetical protein